RGVVVEGRAEGVTGGGVPEPRRLDLAADQDGLAVGAEGDTGYDAVGEDAPELGVVAPPGRQIGAGGMLPAGVAGLGGHAQALDHPEETRADRPLLARESAALQIEHDQA